MAPSSGGARLTPLELPRKSGGSNQRSTRSKKPRRQLREHRKLPSCSRHSITVVSREAIRVAKQIVKLHFAAAAVGLQHRGVDAVSRRTSTSHFALRCTQMLSDLARL